MMRVCSVVVAVALLLVAGSAADAQGDPRLDRLDADVRVQVLTLIDSARLAGIPAEPLIDRALEGRAKRAPGDLIVQAVRMRAAKLGAARHLLGRGTDAEIIAAEGALDAGVSPQTLLEIRRRRPGSVLTTPFGLLGDMMLKGIARDTAAKVILILTDARVDDDDLDELWSMIQRDIAVGMLPSASALLRAESFGAADMEANAPRNNATGGNPPTGSPPLPRPIPPERP